MHCYDAILFGQTTRSEFDTVTNNIVSDLVDFGVVSKFISMSAFNKI